MMNYFLKFIVKSNHICSGILVVTALFFHLNSFSQNPTTDFFAVKGEVQSHLLVDKEDSLSSRELIELRDDKGFPVWFGRDFHKVVCLTGQCRMVHLWLFWDGAGNYLGFQEHPGDPLTKTDHTFFSAADKHKLHRILSDSFSVLKDLKQEELIMKPEKNEGKVDAISGATQPSLQEYLVRNAAYTCYTLWHTVYGDTREEILRIVEKRADEEYLKLIFEKNDPVYMRWAIGFIGRHPEYHAPFYHQLIELVKNRDETVSGQALTYFSEERLTEVRLQKELIRSFEDFSYQRKFELLSKLSEVQQIDDEVILHLLDLFEKEQINASLLGYTFKMVRKENLQNPRIRKKLEPLLNHNNLYVRNITQKLITGSK